MDQNEWYLKMCAYFVGKKYNTRHLGGHIYKNPLGILAIIEGQRKRLTTFAY